VYSNNKEAEKKRKQRKRNINELDAQKGTLEGHTRDISASPSHSSSGIIKKEEDIKEKEDFEKLIDYWQGCKNTVTHQVITKKMISVVKERLKEYPFKDLGNAVYAYNKMMGDGRDFYGKHSHGIEEFFRYPLPDHLEDLDRRGAEGLSGPLGFRFWRRLAGRQDHEG